MMQAVAIRTVGRGPMANEMAKGLADQTLRNQIEKLELANARLRSENAWLKARVACKQSMVEGVYDERLAEYRRKIALAMNRRSRFQRFINLFIVKEDGCER